MSDEIDYMSDGVPEMSESVYEAAVTSHDMLYEATIQFINRFKAHFNLPGYLDSDTIEWDTYSIQFSCDVSHCGCCSDEVEHHSILADYLWSDDWIERETQFRKDREKTKKAAKVRDKDAEKARATKARLREFKKLKIEFGED